MQQKAELGGWLKPATSARDIQVIKTSIPEFNEDLLQIGGLPRGRAIEVYAIKSEGKSSIVQWLVAEFQKQGLKCAWADAEGTFDKIYAKKAGVNLEQLDMIEFGNGEDLLYKLKLTLASNYYDLIAIDSINAITPGGIEVAQVDELSMNEKMETPKMLAAFFKHLDGGYRIKSSVTGKFIQSNVITKNINPKTLIEEEDPFWHKLVQKKTVMVFINHKMNKIGMTFGKKHYTPGGDRKEFTFSLQLNLRVAETKMGKEGGQDVLKYKLIEVKTDKNKVGEPLRKLLMRLYPNGKFEFAGFRKVRETEEGEEILSEEVREINKLGEGLQIDPVVKNPLLSLKEKLDEN